MTPERWQKVRGILDSAMDLRPGDRAAYLDRECAGDAALRKDVDEYLSIEGKLEPGFLESPAAEQIRLDSSTAPPLDSLSAAKHVIGPYHLLELIGEGGMGQVWYAEQRHPVRRRVAIKLIKAGMDTREVVARFESERQALALMDHPAIAKVFDAGSTPEGHPYFVMEYVPGIPITDYCDKHGLTVAQRMELFIRVCEGVQHAHQKAIIHRDLKPSNILVAEVDGKPMPRIIDFGVAKATSQKLTAQTMYTRVGALIGTIGYMSPEQADPIGEDIDTRTDVYSLGAVLYELLTGALPLDFRKIAYDEVLRRLREQDVPRPSTKVTTLGGESALAAKNRGCDPSTLVRQLRGDPDVIALKALEKDRARRYASAAELAADTARFLQHEPVTAHSPSVAYRTRKYLRRHRSGLAVAASALLAIALLVAWWRIPPAVPVVESVVQLTDDGGEPKWNIVSDGSRVYFTKGLLGSLKIFQVSIAGGPVTPVETAFADANLLAVARDGSGLLVKVYNNSGRGSSTLYAPEPLWWVPLPAGEPRRLGNLNAIGADLLPDGRIVFCNVTQGADPEGTDSKTQYFIAERDGSNPRELISFPGFPGEFGASPDGRRVLIGQDMTVDSRLFEIGVDGKGLHEILKRNENESNFFWTPDQKYLVYNCGVSFDLIWIPKSDMWLLPMRAGFLRRPGKPIRLTNGPMSYLAISPSPDGRQIFVHGLKERGELVRYDMRSHEFTPFLSGISAISPAFSRNGKWVAYTSYPDHTLWRSRSDGTDRKQLTWPPMTALFPSISPDGSQVSFCTEKGELFLISMEGGTPYRIDENGNHASWSPDGNLLYYSRRGGGGLIADLRTGKKSLVPSSTGKIGFWLNQDTLLAATSLTASKFQALNLKTQKWTDFAPGASGEGYWSFKLSPDGNYVYYQTGGAEPRVFRLRLADKRVETIATLDGLNFLQAIEGAEISVTPDGSPIFTRNNGDQEIYALNIRWP